MKRTVYVFICFFLLCSSGLLAQNLVIKGTVKDEKGPLPGVSVTLKGKAGGVQTDASGNFSIPVSKSDVLVFSSTGYASQEVVVGNQTELNISLVTDTKSMEGVVVIGYGTKKKQYL